MGFSPLQYHSAVKAVLVKVVFNPSQPALWGSQWPWISRGPIVQDTVLGTKDKFSVSYTRVPLRLPKLQHIPVSSYTVTLSGPLGPRAEHMWPVRISQWLSVINHINASLFKQLVMADVFLKGSNTLSDALLHDTSVQILSMLLHELLSCTAIRSVNCAQVLSLDWLVGFSCVF